jgi:hypothetical protein
MISLKMKGKGQIMWVDFVVKGLIYRVKVVIRSEGTYSMVLKMRNSCCYVPGFTRLARNGPFAIQKD